MQDVFLPGSFTKNFSWNTSFVRLHGAIANGFSTGAVPVSREKWRSLSKIVDRDRQLIPMNFFLFSALGKNDDFLLVDQLVDAAADPYSDQFAQLALFSFHLAQSGHWHHSKRSDGRVAGWANNFIRDRVWTRGEWDSHAFSERVLFDFVSSSIVGEDVTKRKVFTNYRYMLQSAGVLNGNRLLPCNLRQRWFVDAVQLFWDRQILSGNFTNIPSAKALEESLIEFEIYKLMRCSESQCLAFARAAYPEFENGQAQDRLGQLQDLRRAGSIAA